MDALVGTSILVVVVLVMVVLIVLVVLLGEVRDVAVGRGGPLSFVLSIFRVIRLSLFVSGFVAA